MALTDQLGYAEEVAASMPAVTSVTFAAGVPNTGTLLFASAHGLRVGDVLTLSGATPSAWNGSWVVQSVADTTHCVIYMPTTTTSTSVQPTAAATQYGLVTTPAKFAEFVSESVKLNNAVIESAGLRAGNRAPRSDRFAIDRQGAGGDTELEVKTKGFGLLLKHMLGTIATAGPTDSCYTHTATIGSLQGRSLTWQFGKTLAGSTYVQPFTYKGMKIASWELSARKGGVLMLKLTFDGQDETLSTALAVASYPSGDELLTFVGGAITVGSASWDVVTDVTISCNNNLDTDRRFQRASSLQKEPLENGWREITASFACEFNDLTQYNRFAATAAASRVAAVSCVWTGPTLAGATTYPSLTASLPAFRFDGDTPPVTGPGLLKVTVPGKAHNTTGGTNDAISLVYVTTDSTP